VSRINHQPTDRDKATWKRVALFALIGIWLLSGIVGRDPWKPDEPIFVGILHSMFVDGGDAWWSPQIGGYALAGDTPFIHWINAALAWLPMQFLALHEAARFSSVVWTGIAAFGLAAATSRWSGGHISYLTAIIFIGCLGLYDRAHTYTPEVALLASVAIALYGMAELAKHSSRATALLVVAGVIAFMSHGALGLSLVALPIFALAFAPVLSMHRIALFRASLFTLVLCALLVAAFALRAPEAFQDWLDAGAGISFSDRERFAPQAYLIAILWFVWPAWPIAIWTLVLRGRGFAGGWQRAEIVAPVGFLIVGFVALNALVDQRTVYTIVFVPPLVLLAAFGVDTIRRTWYAMIDWFGILVLGIASAIVFLASVALYVKWPANIATWAAKYVPDFAAPLPWFGYAIALIAFLIWVVLVQPAHQHSRRALINWAGCVTFLWVVAQALLIVPADYRTSHRGVFEAINKQWPTTGCVNGIKLPSSHIAMLDYTVSRRVEVVESVDEVSCDYLLIVRDRKDTEPDDTSGFVTLYSGARPGDRSEKIELLRRANARATTTPESKS
jgi:4-amino-4-deoxy-L-arabinose transferase-like glycosyltransferase